MVSGPAQHNALGSSESVTSIFSLFWPWEIFQLNRFFPNLSKFVVVSFLGNRIILCHRNGQLEPDGLGQGHASGHE